jgi:hypothetical protein
VMLLLRFSTLSRFVHVEESATRHELTDSPSVLTTSFLPLHQILAHFLFQDIWTKLFFIQKHFSLQEFWRIKGHETVLHLFYIAHRYHCLML